MNETNMLQQVAELSDMSTADLRKLWQELYQTPPPLFNKASLINKLAYRIQELHYGGLATATRKQLRQIAGGQSVPKRPIVNRPVAGTRLVRDFGGQTHTVTVHCDGYEYNGRIYKSLSAIARKISGTRWSGPAFFGLKPVRARFKD